MNADLNVRGFYFELLESETVASTNSCHQSSNSQILALNPPLKTLFRHIFFGAVCFLTASTLQVKFVFLIADNINEDRSIN